MPDALACATSTLEQRNRRLRQIGYELLHRLREFQGPQNTQQHDEVGALACLDTLDGALGGAGLLGKLGLRHSLIDSASREADCDLLQNGVIRQLRSDFHNPPFLATSAILHTILALIGEYLWIINPVGVHGNQGAVRRLGAVVIGTPGGSRIADRNRTRLMWRWLLFRDQSTTVKPSRTVPGQIESQDICGRYWTFGRPTEGESVGLASRLLIDRAANGLLCNSGAGVALSAAFVFWLERLLAGA
jgi:hypothetical protein